MHIQKELQDLIIRQKHDTQLTSQESYQRRDEKDDISHISSALQPHQAVMFVSS